MVTSNHGEKEIGKLLSEIKIFNYFLNSYKLQEQYEHIATRISLFLPRISNPSLCEIDDLILEKYNQLNDDSLRLQAGNGLFYLIKASWELYFTIGWSRNIKYHIMVMPLTQLVESSHSPIKKQEYQELALTYARFLIETWNLKNACQALKLLRLLGEKNLFYDLPTGVLEWLYKVRNVPQPSCPIKQRFASWMRNQSEILLRPFNNDPLMLVWDRGFSSWKLGPSHIVDLLGCQSFNTMQLDYLYNYFMSSNEQSQRIKLIEYFVKGCMEMNCTYISPQLQEMPNNFSFLDYMYHLVSLFCWYLHDMLGLYSNAMINKWTEIEKYLHGYRREPYLLDNSGGLPGVHTWDDQQVNGDSKRTLNSEQQLDDLTIERHIFFDTFLNRLELMNIVRTALWKTADILQMEKCPESYDSMIFWMNDVSYSPRTMMTKILENPRSVQKEKLKWFEFTMKM